MLFKQKWYCSFLCSQGFHILFDSHNSFAGAASKVLSYLKDEFPGKAILSLPVTPAVLPDQVSFGDPAPVVIVARVGMNTEDMMQMTA